LAKFLDTTGVSYHLQQLIKNTQQQLILISPYLKVNERMKEELQELDRFRRDIRLIFRDIPMDPVTQNWLRGLPSIRTSYCQNLHAKCYLNESEAIITSMNLYEFSQVNNHEMGVLIAKEQEPDLYADVYNEAQKLLRSSNTITIAVSEVPKALHSSKAETAKTIGFCIRCHAELKLNPTVPYCKDCYVKWKKKSNNAQAEKYCHICGRPHASSLNKPTCYECYKANKDKLEFPTPPSK